MIAYLDKYDTTVDVPDNISDADLKDVNENFHHYVDQPTQQPQQEAPQTPKAGVQPSGETPAATAPETQPKWQPNFYQSVMSNLIQPVKIAGELLNPETPQAQAFAGKALEEGTFGLAKPLVEPVIGQEIKDHPAFADAGAVGGGVGSLMVAGGALRALGLAKGAAMAGKGAVDLGLAAGERFIPRAIMSGATFGTRAFIAETVKAFEGGGVNLEQFGKDVLKETAFGTIFGSIGGISNAVASVSSAAGLGFISSKMAGGDNREASLNAAIWAAFETVGSIGKSEALRMEALSNLKDSMGEYIGARNPDANDKDVARAVDSFVDNAMKKAGYDSAEEIAKSGPENLLEGIEKANQLVRNARIPAEPPTGAPALHKLPAPIEPEAAVTPTEGAPVPQTPLQKMVESIKGMFGVKPEPSTSAVQQLPEGPRTYDQKIEDLKAQGHDIAKLPESAFPEDLKDIYHFEQGRQLRADVSKAVSEISGRLTAYGIPEAEQDAVLSHYGLNKVGQLGQAAIPTETFRLPIEDQYKQVYSVLAAERGIPVATPEPREQWDQWKEIIGSGVKAPKEIGGQRDVMDEYKQIPFWMRWRAGRESSEIEQEARERGLLQPNEDFWTKLRELRAPNTKAAKPDARTMDDAEKAVDLMNGYFNPQSQDVKAFAEQYQELSNHDVAQMAHNRGLLEEPNPDLLKAEIDKAKQEKPIISAMVASQSSVKTFNPDKPPKSDDPLTALKLDDGTIVYDPKAKIHADMIKHGVDASHVVDGGFISDGKYRSGSADAGRIGRQARAQKAVEEKRGIISAQIAPGSTMQQPIKPPPLVEVVASSMKASSNEITNIVNPAKAAPLAAQITREQLGKMARSYDMAEASLQDAHDLFEKQSKDKNLIFIDSMERGQAQKNPELDTIAGKLRNLLDSKRREVQDLGKGKLESFIENYFPHIWDQGEKEVNAKIKMVAKRPLEGSKGFLKKRSIEFTSDGIESGLTPVSFNPVDLALIKIREMDKYIMAHRTINEYKANGLAKYVKVGSEAPEGWQKIDDRISTVFKSPMIAVQEAYDKHLMDTLNGVAESLGVDLERSMKSEEMGQPEGLLGFSKSDAMKPGEAGKIWTKFASPESTLAHELGHQLDHIYNLKDKFLNGVLNIVTDQELSELAKERYAGKEVPQKFKDYVQKPDEKIAVLLESYVHARDLLKSKAPNAYRKLVEFLRNPDPNGPTDILKPLADLKPSLVKDTSESEVYAGGSVIAGHIYAQPDAARIINNYLSPGLQKSEIYQAYRYAGNLINQFQLGFSAFHLGFTSLDAAVSKFALALGELEHGHPLKAIRNAMETPIAPVVNIIRGDELLKAWRGEGKIAADDVLAQAMATAGGRARMDQFYATGAYLQLKHHFEAGNLVRGILHIPMAIADISSKPILEYIVPRQKLGVFADIMKMEMENNPGMTHDQIREIAQRAWDSVDNRMGQLVYDNLFWNRTFKDLMMGSVRSVGWNVGTAREFGEGLLETKEIPNIISGKGFKTPHKMNYLIALPFVVGMLGALIQYLRTGKGPQELKDYYFPKTGGVDANGDPHRISLPSYMKDVYHWSQHPAKVAIDKLQPILSILVDMWQNKDYFGTKIRNEDDPIVKQAASEMMFILKQIEPFSIRNMQKNLETENKTLFDTVGPWVGITPAPYDIDQTNAEKAAHEIAASNQAIGGRTEEQMERSRLLSDLTRQYRRGDPKAQENLTKAYESGLISHRQMQNVLINARLTPLQKMVKGMTLEETERVYAKASDEEKAQIEPMLRRKEVTHQREYIAQ